MKLKMKLEGAGQLGAGLKALAKPDELDTIKLAALLEAAEPIRDEAKLEAPFDEGRLFTAVEIETAQPSPRRNRWRIGVAVWVRFTNDYRPRKRAKKGERAYQKGSIPSVYGAFQQFGTRKMEANPWLSKAWESAGGRRAVDRISEALNWSLVALVKKRLSGR